MKISRCLPLFLCLFVCSFAIECRADVVYTFSYTALSGPVNSSSFSFTSPTFVTAGSSPVFTPFTLTDGTTSWTMTKDLIAVLDPAGLNRGCFMFGTPFAQLSIPGPPPFGSPCGFAVGGPGINQAAFEFDTSGGLPTAPGTYPAVSFAGSFDTAAGFENIEPSTGTFSLTIGSIAPRPFTAELTGFRETPPILTSGAGTFTATFDSGGASLSFTLTYADLSSTETQADIHFGQPGVAGNIIVFLCAGPKPACPTGGGTVTGTITEADVLEVSNQGVTGGSLSELLRILRSGDAYVNVHTTDHPAGEIRGQLTSATRI